MPYPLARDNNTNPFLTGGAIGTGVSSGGNTRNTSKTPGSAYSFGAPKKEQTSYRETQAPFGMDMNAAGTGEQHWNNNQNLWTQSPEIDWARQQLPQLNQPGFGENYAQENLGSFGAPGQGQQFWNQVAGLFNQRGSYSGPNNAQDSYNRTVQNIPGSLNPNFDAYYDRALDTATSNMNSEAAARGVYGSSSTLNNVGNVITDINAARANRESDFALADSQNQREWQGLAGGLGRSADITGLNTFSSGLEGLGTFGDLAFNAENADYARDRGSFDIASGVDSSLLNRLGLGFDAASGIDRDAFNRLAGSFTAANTAQDQREGRVNDQFSNQMQMLQTLLPFLQGNYVDILNSDQDYFSQDINTGLGATQNEVSDDRYGRERTMRDLESLLGMLTAASQNERSKS